MKSLLAFICICLCYHNALAQKTKTFKINPGEKVVDAIPEGEKYSYPEFIMGDVYFKNGQRNPARLNYNSLFQEMQFIDGKGDTLSIIGAATIKHIVIGTDTFFYDDGYLKRVADYGKIKLAVKEFIAFTDRQKLGGFGGESSARIDTYKSIQDGTTFKELVAREVLTFVKKTVFYLGDAFNHFEEANKKSLLDFYPSKNKEIKSYLKENKVNFSNEEDLKKIISFLNGQ
jgi:hypothetical protein